MLNLAFVRTFAMLAETGSFRVAAQRLGLAQPTVSQHLKKLEDALGVVLLERNNVMCKPTPRGLALLPYAEALLHSADRFGAAAGGNTISIGCSGNIGAYYIASGLRRFLDTQERPVDWDVRTATNPEIATQLAAGTIDLAAMEWPPTDEQVVALPWRTEPLVVILPCDHPKADRKRLSVQDLLELDLIGGETGSGTGTVLRQALGENATRLRIVKTLATTEAVKSAVSAGLGCSIVLRAAVEEEVKAGRLKSLAVSGLRISKTFWVAYRRGWPDAALPVRLAQFLSSEGARGHSPVPALPAGVSLP